MRYSSVCFVGECGQPVNRIPWAGFDPQPYLHPKFGIVSACLDHGRELQKCGLPPGVRAEVKTT